MRTFFYTLTFFSLCSYGTVETHKAIGTIGMMRLFGIPVPVKEVEKRIEVVREVERARVTFEDALQERLKSSTVPSVVVDGVLNNEASMKFDRMSITRFEQSYMQRAAQITRNQDEQRLWASSWCPFQIMAPHAKRFNLDWSDLLDPETCVHVGMSILEDCWKKAHGKGKERVYQTGICYNGPLGQAYAQRLVDQVSGAAVNKILDGEG